jgi:glycine/D-amino acid oxidase-like deaminating enzyme
MDYQTCGSYELFDDSINELYEEAIDKLAYINQLLKYEIGQEAFKQKDDDIAKLALNQTNHLIFSQYEGQLHPGKMMNSLYEIAIRMGVRFLYGHEVAKIYASSKPAIQLKNKQQLKAEILILANNAFSRELIPDLEVQPARNQVLISESYKNLKIKHCFHYNQGYTYFRNVGDRLLIGGARNLDLLNEATEEFGLTTKIQDFLKQFIVQKNLLPPNFKIETQWSGILGIGKSKKPIIKEVKSNTFAAVRLGGMGIAIGTLVAEKIVNEVLNR